jgi:hypothetical protein
MGELFFFPLGKLIEIFKCDTFFETGTGFGFGVHFARMFPFRNIFSVEILASEGARLRAPFSSDRRIQLFAGRSTEIMSQVLPQIQGNIIFWLDAHFPGAHHHLQGYDAERDLDTRLPLEKELALIKQLRPGKRDVILIDDLRIYEKDNYEWGNMSDYGQEALGKYDSKFLYTMFEETHTAQKFLNHTGYLALLPKTGLEKPESGNPNPESNPNG